MHWRRKWQPTPAFLPGESQGRGSLVGCHLWGCTESDTTVILCLSHYGLFTGKSEVTSFLCSPTSRRRWPILEDPHLRNFISTWAQFGWSHPRLWVAAAIGWDSGNLPGGVCGGGWGDGDPLQYSCRENPMDREEPGGLQSMGLQSQTRLSNFHSLSHSGNLRSRSEFIFHAAECK